MKIAKLYQINTPNIVHEIIDGEAIIINMEKGHYYSLRSTGAEIWASIVRGMSIGEIVHKLSEQYEGEGIEIKTAVDNLIIELLGEDMIIPVATEGGAKNPSQEESQPINKTVPNKFEIPVLEKYTDMEELLLLDPIHEVDQMGWPNMALDTAEEGIEIE